MSDTSGWAASDRASPIVQEYPYGTWSTVWFREYFSDKVVFNWKSDANKTNVVFMQRSQVEPDYQVLADFTYNPPTTNFTVQAWIERGGQILEHADECTVYIFNNIGDQIETLTQDVTQEGVFWLNWDVDATATRRGETYSESDVFFARVEITFSGVTYSSGLTSTLRVAASGVTLGNIEAGTAALLNMARNTGSNVTDLVADSGILRSNVNSIASGIGLLRGEMNAGFSNVVGSLSTNFALLTNSIIPALAQVTNDISILLPAVTNLAGAVSNVNEGAALSLARILTRPTEVVDGTTMKVLYKSRRNYGPTEVDIAVSPAGYSGKMTEISSGLGIYQHELPVNWGIGSYTIICTDPMASDRMIIDVVDQASLSMVPNMLVALSNRMDEVFVELTNVTGVIDGIEDFGPIVRAISNDLRDMTFTVTNEIGKIGELKNLLDGIDKLTNSLANFDASSITNLDQQLNKLTNALSGVDWQDVRDMQADMVIVTQRLEGLDNLPMISSDITNLVDAIANISDVTNITSQLTHITNQLFGVQWDDIRYIRSKVDGITNTLQNLDMDELSARIGEITNRLGVLNWDDVTKIRDDMAQVTNSLAGANFNELGDIMRSVTNSIGNLDWNDILALREGMTDLTNKMAGADLNALSDALVAVTNNLGELDWNDVLAIKDDIVDVTNRLGTVDLDQLSVLLGDVTNRLGTLDWNDIGRLQDDVSLTTNILSGLTDLADITSRLGDLTNAIHQSGAVTNLGPQIAALSNALEGVNWQDIIQLQDDMIATTNALGNLTSLAGVQQTLSSLTNIPSRLDALSNQLYRVDWNDVDRIIADVNVVSNMVANLGDLGDVEAQLAGFSNMAVQVDAMSTNVAKVNWADIDAIQLEVVGITNTLAGLGALGDIADQVDRLTNVVPRIDTLTASLDEVDLPMIATSMNALTNTLAGFNWQTVEGDAVLSQDIWEMLDAKLGNITDNPNVSTFFGRLNQLTTQLSALGSKTEEASRNAKTAKTKAIEATFGIQDLKAAIDSGDLSATLAKLDSVKSDLGEALTQIGEIPGKLPTDEYNTSMMTMSSELLKWARSKGWTNLEKLDLPEEGDELGTGKDEEGVDKPTAEDLNKNMKNVKSSLEFMQKAVDEMRYKVTIDSTLVGQ